MKMISKTDKRLKSVSTPVEATDDIAGFKDILQKYNLIKMGKILGCSLPQFGIMKRMCYVKTPTLGETILINPYVEVIDETCVNSQEGCESLGGKSQQYVVKRPTTIKLYWKDTELEDHVSGPLGLSDSRIIMHEIDHLNGLLICDIGRKVK